MSAARAMLWISDEIPKKADNVKSRRRKGWENHNENRREQK